MGEPLDDASRMLQLAMARHAVRCPFDPCRDSTGVPWPQPSDPNPFPKLRLWWSLFSRKGAQRK